MSAYHIKKHGWDLVIELLLAWNLDSGLTSDAIIWFDRSILRSHQDEQAEEYTEPTM